MCDTLGLVQTRESVSVYSQSDRRIYWCVFKSGTLYVDSQQYVRLSTQRNSIMTFSDIYFQDAYISNTNFIYASKEANSYVKTLISDID